VIAGVPLEVQAACGTGRFFRLFNTSGEVSIVRHPPPLLEIDVGLRGGGVFPAPSSYTVLSTQFFPFFGGSFRPCCFLRFKKEKRRRLPKKDNWSKINFFPTSNGENPWLSSHVLDNQSILSTHAPVDVSPAPSIPHHLPPP
jgi:hypothetical protein